MHVIYIPVSPSNVADLKDHLTWMMTPMDQVPQAQESELDFFTLTDPWYDVLEPI